MDVRRLTRSLPGTTDQVREVRRLVFVALGSAHPRLDDAILLASETTTNAVRHSASAWQGGRFALMIEHTDVWARIAIRDAGSTTMPCLCHAHPTATSGRGMEIL